MDKTDFPLHVIINITIKRKENDMEKKRKINFVYDLETSGLEKNMQISPLITFLGSKFTNLDLLQLMKNTKKS